MRKEFESALGEVTLALLCKLAAFGCFVYAAYAGDGRFGWLGLAFVTLVGL